MKNRITSENSGFSLIELVVFIGIFVSLFYAAFSIGLPEYNRYVLDQEKQTLVDELLDSRSLALAAGTPVATSTTFMGGQIIIDQHGFINGR